MDMSGIEEVRRLTEELAAARAKLEKSGAARATSAKFMRLPAVMAAVGMSRTTIYERIKAGTFPAPIQLGARSVAWDEIEIAEWQQSLSRGIKTTIV